MPTVRNKPIQNTVIQTLERLHVCGEQLFDALIKNDLSRVIDLLEERHRLLEEVAQSSTDALDEEALGPLANSLRAQNERLRDTLDLRRQAIETALADLEQLRRGNASYAAPVPVRRVLRRGLRA